MSIVRGVGFCTLVSALTFILLFGSVPVYAQLPTGTILGVVKDISGGVVPDATITIQNVETNQTRTATTGGDGAFRVPALPVGHYVVKIEKTGFNTQTQRGLVLEVSQELVLNALLEIGTSAQEVVVTGEAPVVNTTTSDLGGLVNEEKMSELPLNGRSYMDLSLMQAGVTQVRGISATIGIGNGVVYSSDGAPMRSNNSMLDGAIMNSLFGYNASSVANTTLGVDGIREYKVVTSNFSAEYGTTMGSQLTLVSKNGTNQFHGAAFEFLRNAVLDARNFFDYSYQKTGKRVPQYQRSNFGGAFGGPIQKDKTFFFGVYEGLREKKGLTTVLNVFASGCHGPAGAVITNTACPQLGATPSVTISSAIAPILAEFSSPNIPSSNQFSYPYIYPTGVNYGQMRVDHNFSAKDTFFARYTVENADVTESPNYPQFLNPINSRAQYVTLSENHIFSSALLNTVRGSYSRTKSTSTVISPLSGPNYSFKQGEIIGTIAVPGITGFGPPGQPPFFVTQNVFTVSDDLYYTKGKHALKFGVLINRFLAGRETYLNVRGATTFANVAGFLSGSLLNYQIRAPGSTVNKYWRWNTFGFYIQDDWRVTSRLTLNLGLRDEFNTPPESKYGRSYALRQLTDTATTQGPELVANKSNFGPRVGFAWDATGRGKTSLRGGFGVYYDIALFGSGLGQAQTSMPPLAGFLTATNASGPLPFVIPLAVPLPSSSPVNFQAFNYLSRQPYMMRWNLAIDQQLPGKIGLNVSYVGDRGVHIFTQEEGNPCIPTSIDASGPLWATSCGRGRANSSWGYINSLTADSYSTYHALQVTVQRRLSNGLEFQSAYTFSRAIDDGQGQFNIDNQGNRIWTGNHNLDKGPAAFDVTHNWRFNLLYHIPDIKRDGFVANLAHGWWVASILSAQTGYPFTPLDAGSRSQSLVQITSADRPNLGPTYDPQKVIIGSVTKWFDPTMFSLQPVGRLGNAPRNILRGPHLVNVDFSVNKDTKLKFLGEAGMLQFRAEFFNIMNHANFGNPNATVFAGALTNATEAPLGSAGQITTLTTNPRDIQLALKVIF